MAQHSPAFIAYVKSRDYDLHTVSGYGKLLEDVGFTNVSRSLVLLTFVLKPLSIIFFQVNPMNKTGLMIDIMKMELGKFSNIRRSFIEEFSEYDYNYIEKVGCSICRQ